MTEPPWNQTHQERPMSQSTEESKETSEPESTGFFGALETSGMTESVEA